MEEKTVLVIDDEPDTVTFLTTVLGDHGFRTLEAYDGEEAVKLIETAHPDLVTLDITMPEKSGVAVYRFLKEQDLYKGIPVIIVTGISDDFRRFISSRRQVPPPEGYLSKPIDPDQLVEMVEDLLEKKATIVH